LTPLIVLPFLAVNCLHFIVSITPSKEVYVNDFFKFSHFVGALEGAKEGDNVGTAETEGAAEGVANGAAVGF